MNNKIIVERKIRCLWHKSCSVSKLANVIPDICSYGLQCGVDGIINCTTYVMEGGDIDAKEKAFGRETE